MDVKICVGRKGGETGSRETCLLGLVFTAWTVKVAELLRGTSSNKEFMELVFPPFISYHTINSITVWGKKIPGSRVKPVC